MMDTWTRHGLPIYQRLLHANFLDEADDGRREFALRLLDAATSLLDREVACWLNSGWREQLTAAWIVAVRREQGLRGQISTKLLASAACFAGQGLCVATARYRDRQAADVLMTYLRTYLPVHSREYDQEWAIGSLAWLDGRLGTAHAQPFIDAPDLWKVSFDGRKVGALLPERGIERVARAMAFLEGHDFDAV